MYIFFLRLTIYDIITPYQSQSLQYDYHNYKNLDLYKIQLETKFYKKNIAIQIT